jgi:hypothetical protein
MAKIQYTSVGQEEGEKGGTKTSKGPSGDDESTLNKRMPFCIGLCVFAPFPPSSRPERVMPPSRALLFKQSNHHPSPSFAAPCRPHTPSHHRAVVLAIVYVLSRTSSAASTACEIDSSTLDNFDIGAYRAARLAATPPNIIECAEAEAGASQDACHLPNDKRFAALGQKGVTLWMTGLSGSGKSTIAKALEEELVLKYGKHVQVRLKPTKKHRPPPVCFIWTCARHCATTARTARPWLGRCIASCARQHIDCPRGGVVGARRCRTTPRCTMSHAREIPTPAPAMPHHHKFHVRTRPSSRRFLHRCCGRDRDLWSPRSRDA